MSSPEFIFTTCQVGAEAVLKHEISREWPAFKLAYSRPGFLTFKVGPDADVGAGFDLRSVFARAYGLSLGKAQGETLAERAIFTAMLARSSLPGPLRLHVWEREKNDPLRKPEDERQDEGFSTLTEEAERQVRAQGDTLFLPSGPAQDGDVVLSVVLVEEDEWWLGYHLQSRYHRPWAGGIAPVQQPEHAPSRAYLKAHEGMQWPGLPIAPGESVLELGSAPGGASLALLERGLRVTGVDPADMDPGVLSNSAFRHIRLQAKQLAAEEVGAVEWLVSDMNLSPEESLEAIERVLKNIDRSKLLGGLLTLKLTNWAKASEVPEVVRRSMEKLLHIGFSRVQAAQLYFNRREVCVACLTTAGELRITPAIHHGRAKTHAPERSRAGARARGSD